MADVHQLTAQLEQERVVADAAKRDDGGLGAAHHCGSIVAVTAANGTVSQAECDLALVTSIHAETLVMADSLIEVNQVLTSSPDAVRTARYLLATVNVTLAARWDLTSNDTMKEKACDRYGKDSCGKDDWSTDGAQGVRGVGSVFGVDCYSRAQLAKLLSRED